MSDRAIGFERWAETLGLGELIYGPVRELPPSEVGLAADELPSDSPARPFLREVSRAASRAAELTQQLLEYAGKGRLITAPLDLSRVAREAADPVRSVIPDGVKIHDQVAPALPAVEGDKTALRQVIMNLLANAAESIRDGCGHITLRSGWLTPSQAHLARDEMPAEVMADDCAYVEVEDSGCGMDEEVQKRIFEPFSYNQIYGAWTGVSRHAGHSTRPSGRHSPSEPPPGRAREYRCSFRTSGSERIRRWLNLQTREGGSPRRPGNQKPEGAASRAPGAYKAPP